MLAVVFAWVFFRAESFSAAKLMFEGMLGFHGILPTSVVEQNQTVSALFRFVNISIQPGVEAWICLLIIWCIALLSIVWFMPNTQEFVLLRRQAGLLLGGGLLFFGAPQLVLFVGWRYLFNCY